MKILIIGNLGTIGVPLSAELTRRGHDVYGADTRHSGNENDMRADISKRLQVQRVMDWCAPDMVYCLAAEFGRHNGELYYEQCWETNVIGGRHVMEECAARSIRLVFMSSSEAYGETPQPLMREQDTDNHALRHHNDYAMSKWVNEQQIMNLERTDKTFKAVRVRFFNAYGPGELFTPFRSVVCLFVHAAITGGEYTVFKGYHRVFMYIDDAVNTLSNIATRFIPGRVYNVGGEEYCSVERLHELIKDALGKDYLGKANFLSHDGHNTVNKRPDVSLAKKEIDHQLTTDLITGIDKTIEWAMNVYPPLCRITSDSMRSA